MWTAAYQDSVNLVRLQIDSLTAKGATSHYMFVALFKGYLATPDQEFYHYIKQIIKQCEEVACMIKIEIGALHAKT